MVDPPRLIWFLGVYLIWGISSRCFPDKNPVPNQTRVARFKRSPSGSITAITRWLD